MRSDQSNEIDAPKQYSVSSVLRLAASAVEKNLPLGIWIKGEVSDFKERDGHCYLELVERAPGAKVVSLPAAIWKSTWPRIRQKIESAGVQIVNGQEMLMFGTVRLYDVNGRLKFNVSDISIDFTLGQIETRRRQILQRLRQEGLIGLNGKLELSPLPFRIAVLTADKSKAIDDFNGVLKGSNRPFKIVHYDVPVQGVGMSSAICAALRRLSRWQSSWKLDAICIVRGGGSAMDLGSWNSYEIGATIAQMPVPVICGIGHAEDRVAIDEVVHTRLTTPTAVAQFLVERIEREHREYRTCIDEIVALTRTRIRDAKTDVDKRRTEVVDQSKRLVALMKKDHHALIAMIDAQARSCVWHHRNSLKLTARLIVAGTENHLRSHRATIANASKNVRSASTSILRWKRAFLQSTATELPTLVELAISRSWRQTKAIGEDIYDNIKQRLVSRRLIIEGMKDRLGDAIERIVPRETARLDRLRELIDLCDPLVVMTRGYSLTYDEQGKRIKHANSVGPGTVIRTVLPGGRIKSTVIETHQDLETT